MSSSTPTPALPGSTPRPADGLRFVSRLTHNSLALVLAGGRGARLGPLTDWRAKPAVPFGGKFRIIDFTLSNCINSGIRRIGILTQYKAHSLIRHVQRGWGFLRGEFGEFVELLPAQQRLSEKWYAGTADAVYQNIDIIRRHAPDYVVILAGDHVYKMDYGPMIAQHAQRGADVTIGCIEVPIAQARQFGTMAINESGRVQAFEEKPARPKAMPGRPDLALASMGIYVFSREFLLTKLNEDARDADSAHDFGRNIIPSLIDSCAVDAYPFREVDTGEPIYWRDVGTIDAYWRANLELAAVVPLLDIYDNQWPIWTYQEQAPPAKFVFDDADRRGMAVDSIVSSGCIISGAVVRRSCLFYNVRVEARSWIEDSVLLPDVTIGERCRIARAVIDKGCRIPDDFVVGIDPRADRKRFHVTEDAVTLVTPAMLGQSMHDAS